MANNYIVPLPQHGAFAQTGSAAQRARVLELLEAFKDIAEAKDLRTGARNAAAVRRPLMQKGWATNTILKLYLKYQRAQREGNPEPWRVLFPPARNDKTALPKEFIPYWQGIWGDFKSRKTAGKAAVNHLYKKEWLAGKAVPGYGLASQWYAARGRALPTALTCRPSDMPEGWSYQNLMRYIPKRAATQLALKQGYLAAHGSQPDMLRTDRSALRPLERIYFDDFRPDQQVLFLNGPHRQNVFPLGVLAIDGATGMPLAGTFKPRLMRDDGKREGVERNMLRGVLLQLFERHGLPPYTVTLVVENAAAAITADDERFLLQVFGGRVRVERTKFYRNKLSPNGFMEAGGSPFGKSPVEVFFSKFHNAMAYLPGATGARYDLTHEALEAQTKEALQILDQADALGILRTDLAALWTPLPIWKDYLTAAYAAIELFRYAHDHQMQGFEEIVEGRLPDGRWLPYAQLQHLLPAAELAVTLVKQRKESPMERFHRLCNGVVFEPVKMPLLRGYFADKRTVRVINGSITVRDNALCADPMIFRQQGNPCLSDFEEGRSYDGVLEGDLSAIALFRDGTYMGTVARQHFVDITDELALQRRAHAVHAARAQEAAALQPILARADAEIADGRARNAALGIVTKQPSLTERKDGEPKRPRPPKRLVIDIPEPVAPALAGYGKSILSLN